MLSKIFVLVDVSPHEFSNKKRILQEREKDLPDSGVEIGIASRKPTKINDMLFAIQMF